MYKEKLIKYVLAKNKCIKNMTDIDYVTKDDIDDIMSWEEEECKQIWKKLNPIDAMQGCPWCLKIKHKQYCNCDGCSYMSRNGECGINGRINSIYDRAKELGIRNILTSDEIVEAYNKIDNED